ncbi:hypothetical protein B0T16DRAFT_459183 [Cercophora newfieldiana]|uniref:Ubiquitin 3 binding protein But2 C-terminal domain-containing protein n=1 Tax=Cercophora newfieldiana TaxID=92897 RepID=A0AA39XZ54_9PEZI|nr:hypothetical protein B0T16DRAFT_459183 [Cercophora newfieldiana]
MIFTTLLLALLSLAAAAPSSVSQAESRARVLPRQSQDCLNRSLSNFYWILNLKYSGRIQLGSPDVYPIFPSQANITFDAFNSATGLTTTCTFNETQFTGLTTTLYCYSPPSLPAYPAITTFSLARSDSTNTSTTTWVGLDQEWVYDGPDGTPLNFHASDSFTSVPEYSVSITNNTDWEIGEIYSVQEESLSLPGLVLDGISVTVSSQQDDAVV